MLRWPGNTHNYTQREINSVYLLISWHKTETGFRECAADRQCRTDHAMSVLTADQMAVVKDSLLGINTTQHQC